MAMPGRPRRWFLTLAPATSDIEAGMPAAETPLGSSLGLALLVFGLLWRMTTPRFALPLAESVAPFGERPTECGAATAGVRKPLGQNVG